jgi:hypothetical protein
VALVDAVEVAESVERKYRGLDVALALLLIEIVVVIEDILEGDGLGLLSITERTIERNASGGAEGS